MMKSAISDFLLASTFLLAASAVPIPSDMHFDAYNYFLYLRLRLVCLYIRLYYAKIGIGTPSNDYYVQVDTGSDIMWVNCIGCDQCPRRGYHGLELAFYNRKDSLSGKLISCGRQFCKDVNGGWVSGCYGNNSCYFNENYGNGSYSMGYFVEAVVQYDLVSGDLQTNSTNGTVIFGLVSSVGWRNGSRRAEGKEVYWQSEFSILCRIIPSNPSWKHRWH